MPGLGHGSYLLYLFSHINIWGKKLHVRGSWNLPCLQGDYSGRVELTDNSDGQTIVCVEFEFSSKDVSNNGLFGK